VKDILLAAKKFKKETCKLEREACVHITVERHLAMEEVAYEDKSGDWRVGYRTACKDIHDLIMERDE